MTRVDEATAQRIANDVTVNERAATELDDVPAGQVLCQHEAGGWSFYAWRRSDLTPEQAASFDRWARQRAFILFLTRDLDVDGWFTRTSDERWQITYPIDQGPPDPFEPQTLSG